MKGFSARNLKYMEVFAHECPQRQFAQKTAAHIPAIPIGQRSAAQLSQPIADQLPRFHTFDRVKALVSYWKSADLFQLTDQELNRESTLFTHDSVQRGLLKSYIFIAIKLVGAEKQLFQHVGWIGGVPNGFLDKRFGRLPRVVFFQAVC